MSETCTTLWNGSEMIGGDTAADASNIVYTNAANIRQTVKGALDNGAMIKMPYEEYKSLSEEERNAGVYEVTGCPDSYADRVMLLETQAEYDALTEAEKLNGTSYFVKEGPDQFDAKNIHYSDPTGETTNAGDALDKLNNNLTNINVYVGEDEKLHFVDSTGADSVLPFSYIFEQNNVSVNINTTVHIDCGFFAKNIIIHGVNGSVVFETVCTESYNIYAYGGDGEAVRTQPTTSFIQVSNITDNGFDVTGSYWRDAMCYIIATK